MENRTLNDAYTLRLPDGWRDAIKARAARNRRTMNAEILSALEALVQPARGDERQSAGEARA
ncbi:Arc family DNA-binding protein [Cereibacter sphaeroides]|nr:Arc family DNA-binding protein [Cereibacter sphaeroides]